MIRGAVIHFASEQPLVCDLKGLPTAADACIVVTNLRFVDGRRPSFIDHPESWFLYPLSTLRFIEIAADAIGGEDDVPALAPGEEVLSGEEEASEEAPDEESVDDFRLAEDLLRRMREA